MELKTKVWDNRIFVITFLAVFIVHGTIIFNKLSWHDDVVSTFVGWNESLAHGRWMYDIMASLVMKYSGAENIPVVHGCISAVCIGMIACIIFAIFEIRDKISQIVSILIFWF